MTPTERAAVTKIIEAMQAQAKRIAQLERDNRSLQAANLHLLNECQALKDQIAALTTEIEALKAERDEAPR
jgi:predicted RNase H-like nuclease (RuvC/YqgF family)